MHTDRTTVAARPPASRSAVANQSRLFVEGLDGRSALARRYRDLVGQFTSDVGGNPAEAQKQVIRRAASLSVWCEAVEARLAAGEDIDIGPYTTACNSVRRLLLDIGLQRVARDVSDDLYSYMREKAAERASGEPAVVEAAEPASDETRASSPVSAPVLSDDGGEHD